jgi:hypothetical protein
MIINQKKEDLKIEINNLFSIFNLSFDENGLIIKLNNNKTNEIEIVNNFFNVLELYKEISFILSLSNYDFILSENIIKILKSTTEERILENIYNELKDTDKKKPFCFVLFQLREKNLIKKIIENEKKVLLTEEEFIHMYEIVKPILNSLSLEFQKYPDYKHFAKVVNNKLIKEHYDNVLLDLLSIQESHLLKNIVNNNNNKKNKRNNRL